MSNMTNTRRNLIKAAAWSAPVVVASALVPAYAASAQPSQPADDRYEIHGGWAEPNKP